jgi:hypothetical protein
MLLPILQAHIEAFRLFWVFMATPNHPPTQHGVIAVVGPAKREIENGAWHPVGRSLVSNIDRSVSYDSAAKNRIPHDSKLRRRFPKAADNFRVARFFLVQPTKMVLYAKRQQNVPNVHNKYQLAIKCTYIHT